MAETNTLLTNAMITYEAARTLMNNLVFARKINRQNPHRRGNGPTVSIRKPPRFLVQDGRVAVPQPITEQFVDLTLTYRKNVSINFSSQERTLSMDNFRRRYINPAIVPLANQIDRDAIEFALPRIANAVGSPGTVPNSILTYNLAGAKLLDEATLPDDTWCMVISPTMQAVISSEVSTLFNPQPNISRVYEMGRMGKQGNFDYYFDQNMVAHTVGALGGAPLVNVSGQTGSTLNTDGWTASVTGILKQGDRFTIGAGATGVYATNPQSHESTGQLRQFVVTGDVNSDGSGNVAIPISPAIVTSGAFQTVVSAPVDGATINVLGAANVSTTCGIGFHGDFMTLAFADLDEPYTGNSYFVTDDDLGVSMRVWESSDWTTDLHGIRIDVWYGMCMIYPEWAAVVYS